MVSNIDKRKNRVVLSLGGNIGEVKQVFESARKHLKETIGNLCLESSLYQTKAWGYKKQADFLNQVIVLDTQFSAFEVLDHCLKIELKMGRIRKEKWHERTLDIDILFFNSEIVKTKDLIIPHRYIQDRNFILSPLAEIMPNYIHPIYDKSINELKNNCKDDLSVYKI